MKTEPKGYTHYVKFHGRKYRLMKRVDSKDAPWWLRTKINGRAVWKSLLTNVAEVAERRAKQELQGLIEGKWQERSGPGELKSEKITYPTMGEVFKINLENLGARKEKSVKGGISAWKCILRAALDRDSKDDCLDVNLEQITPALILKYKRKVLAPFHEQDEGEASDEGMGKAKLKAMVTANSYLGQAFAILGGEMPTIFRTLGVHIPPCVKEAAEVSGFRIGKPE